MKSFRFRLLIAALAVVLGGAVAKSQTASDASAPPPMQGHRFAMKGHRMGFMAKQLNLTDDQKAQMKTIMEKAHTSMKPLMQQSHLLEQQIHQYAEGNYDESTVRSLAKKKADIEVELTVARTQVHNQMFQLLTPDQQAKAKQLEADRAAHRQAHMQQHMKDMPPAAPPQ
jgi:Spy/CpxP family protein refolding chaperone